MYKAIWILLPFFSLQLLCAQGNKLKDFPENFTPQEVGKRLAYHSPLAPGTNFMQAGTFIMPKYISGQARRTTNNIITTAPVLQATFMARLPIYGVVSHF